MGNRGFQSDKQEVIEDLGIISKNDSSKITAQIVRYNGKQKKLSIVVWWKYSTEGEDAWKFSKNISLTAKQYNALEAFFDNNLTIYSKLCE